MSAFVTIPGNLTRDPEVKQIGNQNACTFSVACKTDQKNQSGEYITNFYDCTWFGKRGEAFVNRAQKGTGVSVVGSFAFTTYKTKNGEESQSLKVNVSDVEVMARGKSSSNNSASENASAASDAADNQITAAADSLPF